MIHATFLAGVAAAQASTAAGADSPGLPIWISSLVLFCLIFLALGARAIQRELRAMKEEERRTLETEPGRFTLVGFGTTMADGGRPVSGKSERRRTAG